MDHLVQEKYKMDRKKICTALICAFVLSLLAEVFVFMREYRVEAGGNVVSLLIREDCTMNTVGYSVEGSQYTQESDDPQIILYDLEETVESVAVTFLQPIDIGLAMQVFYSCDGGNFTEANSVIVTNDYYNADYLIANLPEAQYDALRFDIDGSFELEDICVSDEKITTSIVFGDFSIAQTLTLFLFFFVSLLLLMYWQSAEPNKKKLTNAEFLACATSFLFYLYWAAVQPFNYAPDELMRYEVTQFLFNYNRLPVGDELVSIWGFSYAHYPAVLCSQLGYVFMKAASLFTGSDDMLLLAARMVSVVCGTGTVYFTIKASKQLFQSPARWILIVFVAAMPQAVFLNSYVNNDSVAFLGTAMIFYAWTLGMTEDWNYKNATLLAVGISVCALAYYNSYAWILCSIIFFLISCFVKNKNQYKRAMKLTAYIAAIVLLLISYSFIRHLVLYNDLLGFKTCAYYGELYAIDSLKPSVRISLAEAHTPLSEMLFDPRYNWIEVTWKSFIGVFGYMTYYCPEIVYTIITGIVLLGCFALIIKFFSNIKFHSKQDKVQRCFHFCVASCAIITVILSVIQSYYRDFQPQGRYCYPAFIPLAFATAKGYEYILFQIKKNEYNYVLITAVCTTMVCLLLAVFATVFLPSLIIRR